MKAGRELDALVAEKVMGIDLKKCSCSKFGQVCEICLHRDDLDFSKKGPSKTPRPYSTDIAAAWEVAEKAFGGNLEITHFSGKYTVKDSIGAPYFETSAPTLPEAICLAALKTLAAG